MESTTEIETLRLRYAREHSARLEAEAIGERATRELFSAVEELKRLDQAKTEFVAIASHELQTPLAPISGLAGTLLASWDTLDAEQKRASVVVIHRQAERLRRLVQDLLTVSRIDAGALHARTKVVSVLGSIREAIEEVGPEARTITVTCAEDLLARADPDHLTQILLNFITNALRHGEPPVAVDAAPAGPRVEIRVRDGGKGVPDEFVPRLFERFSQAFLATERSANGTGLGLYVARGLSQASGGDSWYEPGPDGGSCFAVSLPRAET